MYRSCACTFNDISSKPALYVLTGLQAKLVTGARLSLLVCEFNICYRESYSVGVQLLPSVGRRLLQVPQHFYQVVLRLNEAIPENIFVYTMGSFMELQVQGGITYWDSTSRGVSERNLQTNMAGQWVSLLSLTDLCLQSFIYYPQFICFLLSMNTNTCIINANLVTCFQCLSAMSSVHQRVPSCQLM